MKGRIFLTFSVLALALLTGCGGTGSSPSQEPSDGKISQGQKSEGQEEESGQQSGVQEGEPAEGQSEAQEGESAEGQPEQQAGAKEDQPAGQQSGDVSEFGFEALENRIFDFSSGAGAWCTQLLIDGDGTFEGIYSDSDMGDTGEGYPNGTRYYCSFTGKFDDLEKVDEFTYKMKLVSLLYEDEPDQEEIIDGIRYIYSGANGLVGGTDFLLYLPGSKLAELPEGYRGWVGYYYLENTTETELPYYGIYNVKTEEGFSSFAYEQQSLAERIAMEIAFAEESGEHLEAELQEASSQGDMNAISAELFRTWDETLNVVWRLLESELDEETMETLRAEEREWIAVKDAEVEAAGLEFEGGSLQPMMESMKAAELTKARVYELEKYAQ